MTSQRSGSAVFLISVGVTLGVVLFGLLSPESFGSLSNRVFDLLVRKFGWAYMLCMNFYVVFAVYLALSKYGKTRLGPPDSRPEFSTVSWFAMLFSAGMGIGLVFYGVGEPLLHFISPPTAEPRTVAAATEGMRKAFFHWGIHPWASFCVLALAIAYFQFRKNAPGLISSIFLPILGAKGVQGPFGKLIDILAIFATVAGVATSLGLGTLQINSGLTYLFGMPAKTAIQLAIIGALALVFTASAVMGLDRGIKLVANTNLYIAAFLLGTLFVTGPTMKILESFMTASGEYLSHLVSDSLTMAPYGGKYEAWLGSWTVFYWAWWIAWAPFVGSFIARISRGRTIREFVSGALIAPALGSFAWFAVFGTSALHLEMTKTAPLAERVAADVSTGVFEMYRHFAFGYTMSILMVVLIATFFITSANSATFVLSMFSSRGDLNPPRNKMTVWGIIQAALAFVLLMTGGLKSLQTVSIAAAAPFALVIVLACWSLLRGLRQENL